MLDIMTHPNFGEMAAFLVMGPPVAWTLLKIWLGDK